MAQEQEVQVRQLPLRLSEPEYDALKVYAFFTKTSMNEVLRAALAEYLLSHADDEFDAIVGGAQSKYRLALDKLATL